MKVYLVAILFLFLGKSGLANDPWKALLNQLHRPTIEQIELALEKKPNPYLEKGSSTHQVRQLRGEDRLAFAIAAMEGAFPGATWAELGRDAVFVGDVFDAFYRSIGQKDRVVRLNASHPSFQDAEWETVYGFLKTNGFDASTIMNSYPYIMFDTTSFSHTRGIGGGASQSVRLVKAGYQAFSNLGHDPKKLVKKFNFVSIGGMYSPQIPELFSRSFDLNKAFSSQVKSMTETGFKHPFYINLGSYTYSTEWHGIFEAFRWEGDRVVTSFSPSTYAYGGESSRKAILGELTEIIQIVSEGSFLETVQMYAHRIGYEFPLKRTQKITKVPPEKSKQAATKLQSLQEKANEERLRHIREEQRERRTQRNRKHKISPAGAEYIDRIEDRIALELKPSEALAFVLEDLPVAKNLTDVDVIAIFRTLLASFSRYSDVEVTNALAAVVANSDRLRDLYTRRRLRTDLYGEWGYRVHGNYEKVLELIKGDCRREMINARD